MIARYGFFDSVEGDEREYSEADFARLGQVLAIDGVRGGEDALKVTADEYVHVVRVNPGMAMIRGRYYVWEDDGSGGMTYYVGATTTLPRIDRVVLALYYGSREIRLEVRRGVPAENPVPPTLLRNSACYMLSLAQVRVEVGEEVIQPENIIDERHDEDVCGMMIVSADAAMRKAKEAETAAAAAQKTADNGASAAAAAQKTADDAKEQIDAMKKIGAGTSGNLLMFDENGNAKDSGKAADKLGTGVTYSLSGTVLTITTL